jgi:hypothetical protein
VFVVTPLIVSSALPVFVTVNVWGRPEVPTYWGGKAMLVGDNPTLAPIPIPFRVTLCGLSGALSMTFNEATKLPTAVGVNVTAMPQLPFTGMDAPQLLLCTKLLLFAPLITSTIY